MSATYDVLEDKFAVTVKLIFIFFIVDTVATAIHVLSRMNVIMKVYKTVMPVKNIACKNYISCFSGFVNTGFINIF